AAAPRPCTVNSSNSCRRSTFEKHQRWRHGESKKRTQNCSSSCPARDATAPGVALTRAFALFARPLTRMGGGAVRGSVGDASRICGGFLRVHGASIPPPPRAGLCHARPSGVRAGERYGPSVRRCAGRLGQVAPVPCATHGFAPTADTLRV